VTIAATSTSTATPLSMLIPDFPFPYDDYLRHQAGIGDVPADMYGT
jgi:hypothetical protein